MAYTDGRRCCHRIGLPGVDGDEKILEFRGQVEARIITKMCSKVGMVVGRPNLHVSWRCLTKQDILKGKVDGQPPNI